MQPANDINREAVSIDLTSLQYGTKPSLIYQIYQSVFAFRHILFLAFLLITIILPHTSYAQSSFRASFQVELNEDNETETLPIGPHIYLTEQTDSEISYDYVIKRFLNNFRGERQTQEIINLGFSYNPAWMVFSVANNTENERWVLDFGNIFNGRYALVTDLIVKDHTHNQTFINTRDNKNVPEGLLPYLKNASIPLTIPRNSTSVFAIYIQTETPCYDHSHRSSFHRSKCYRKYKPRANLHCLHISPFCVNRFFCRYFPIEKRPELLLILCLLLYSWFVLFHFGKHLL